MKTIKVTFLVAMLAVLGGCMVVPVAPGPPAYYTAPAYYGPSIGIGIYGGGGYGHGGGGGYGRGYGYGGYGHH